MADPCNKTTIAGRSFADMAWTQAWCTRCLRQFDYIMRDRQLRPTLCSPCETDLKETQ